MGGEQVPCVRVERAYVVADTVRVEPVDPRSPQELLPELGRTNRPVADSLKRRGGDVVVADFPVTRSDVGGFCGDSPGVRIDYLDLAGNINGSYFVNRDYVFRLEDERAYELRFGGNGNLVLVGDFDKAVVCAPEEEQRTGNAR